MPPQPALPIICPPSAAIWCRRKFPSWARHWLYPERPFAPSSAAQGFLNKLNVINNLLEKVDRLIIGGGMAYTFVAAKGYGIGKLLSTQRRSITART